MPYNKHYNSLEARQKRSDRATKAVNARWERHHAKLVDEPLRVTTDPNEPIFELTFKRCKTGEENSLTFYPGPRLNNYRITVDGKKWRTCGFTDALERIAKSCYRTTERR